MKIVHLAAAIVLMATVTRAQDTCKPPEWWTDPTAHRASSQDPRRLSLRAGLDSIYRSDDLRRWKCQQTWVPKDTSTKTDTSATSKELAEALRLFGQAFTSSAGVLRWAIILGAIFLVGWVA